MAQGKDPVTRANGGSDRSHQIEADIERTRTAMDRTVDAIAGKLTPQQLLLEAMGVFKDGSSALATKVVETARQHPVPATIIGIGLGLIFMEKARGESVRRPVDDDTRNRSVGFGGYGEHAAGEPAVRTEAPPAGRSDGFAATVRDKASDVKDSVAHGAMEAREKVGEKVEQVKEQLPVYARQQWHDAQLGFWQAMDQQPFAVGLAVLAAGVAAGLTVPASRKENELMGETRDRLVDQAKDLGREAVDKGKQVARAATDVVKTEVERQGLKPGAIAEKVRTISREAEQALKKETEKVVPQTLKATGTPLTGAGQVESNPGGAAGRGMSAGFAEASQSPAGTWDPDSTVPGPGVKIVK